MQALSRRRRARPRPAAGRGTDPAAASPRRAWLAGLALLGAVPLASGAAEVPTSKPARPTPVRQAERINLKASDLPSAMRWASKPAGARTAAARAAGRAAASCLRALGAAGADPFGTSGTVGGTVLADVSSPQFSNAADKLTGLPGANSEVVVVSSAKLALGDLAALHRPRALSCLARLWASTSSLQGAGKVTATASYGALPRHGSGGGGVHVRLVERGGNLPIQLYNDEYFYVEGNKEVSLSFVDLSAPFKASWAATTIAKVMSRAAAAPT